MLTSSNQFAFWPNFTAVQGSADMRTLCSRLTIDCREGAGRSGKTKSILLVLAHERAKWKISIWNRPLMPKHIVSSEKCWLSIQLGQTMMPPNPSPQLQQGDPQSVWRHSRHGIIRSSTGGFRGPARRWWPRSAANPLGATCGCRQFGGNVVCITMAFRKASWTTRLETVGDNHRTFFYQFSSLLPLQGTDMFSPIQVTSQYALADVCNFAVQKLGLYAIVLNRK